MKPLAYYINRSALRSLLSLLRHPAPKYWKRYFALGTRAKWTDVKLTGWQELPTNPSTKVFQVVGIADTKEMFYTIAEVEQTPFYQRGGNDLLHFLTIKQKSTREQLDTYLNPQCRCKVGFHWKCPVH